MASRYGPDGRPLGPEEVMGDVMGDLNGRRGRVLGMDTKGKYQVILAQAPMAEVLQYALDCSQNIFRKLLRQDHSKFLPVVHLC